MTKRKRIRKPGNLHLTGHWYDSGQCGEIVVGMDEDRVRVADVEAHDLDAAQCRRLRDWLNRAIAWMEQEEGRR